MTRGSTTLNDVDILAIAKPEGLVAGKDEPLNPGGRWISSTESHCCMRTLGKLVTEKPVDFVGFDDVVEFNKNRQNDDNVVKAYKG